MTDCAPNEQPDIIISTSIPLLHQCKYMCSENLNHPLLPSRLNSCVYASSLPAPALCFLSSDLPLSNPLPPPHNTIRQPLNLNRIVRECSLCFLLPRFDSSITRGPVSFDSGELQKRSRPRVHPVGTMRLRLLWQRRAAGSLESTRLRPRRPATHRC